MHSREALPAQMICQTSVDAICWSQKQQPSPDTAHAYAARTLTMMLNSLSGQLMMRGCPQQSVCGKRACQGESQLTGKSSLPPAQLYLQAATCTSQTGLALAGKARGHPFEVEGEQGEGLWGEGGGGNMEFLPDSQPYIQGLHS